VREIRPLRLTWRGLETWPWWNCEPTTQSKERGWKPFTYRARASPRPYVRPAKAGAFCGSQSRRGKSQKPRSLDGREEGNQ
jgi:hypothetical protein